MYDTHCHIQFNGFKDDYDEVIKRCKEKDCTMFAIGTQKDTSQKAVEFAQKYENIYAIVGLHPIHCCATEVDEEETSFVSREEEFDYEYYKNLAQSSKVVGIGECGLELYHIPEDRNKEEILAKQKKVFLAQIKLARELNLPMSIHIRDAYEEVLDVIASEVRASQSRGKNMSLRARYERRNPSNEYLPSSDGIATSLSAPRNDIQDEGRDCDVTLPMRIGITPRNNIRGVIHCYSSNWKNAQQFLDLGFYLGFTGAVTFPARKTNPQPTVDLLEVIKKCPLERIVIETDSPYLAPQAYRGKRCEPWMVEEVAKKIAEVKGLGLGEVMEQVERNTKKLFLNF